MPVEISGLPPGTQCSGQPARPIMLLFDEGEFKNGEDEFIVVFTAPVRQIPGSTRVLTPNCEINLNPWSPKQSIQFAGSEVYITHSEI